MPFKFNPITGKLDLVNAEFSRTPVTVTYAATITPAASGSLSIQRISATGDLTINEPTGGEDGCNIELWITASGGADREVTLHAGIVIPTSSSFVSPVTIAAGKKAKFLLQYDGTMHGGQWELTSYITGYGVSAISASGNPATINLMAAAGY